MSGIHLKVLHGIQTLVISRLMLKHSPGCRKCDLFINMKNNCINRPSAGMEDSLTSALPSRWFSKPCVADPCELTGDFLHEKYLIFKPGSFSWYQVSSICNDVNASILSFRSSAEEERFFTHFTDKWIKTEELRSSEPGIEYYPLMHFLGIHRNHTVNAYNTGSKSILASVINVH